MTSEQFDDLGMMGVLFKDMYPQQEEFMLQEVKGWIALAKKGEAEFLDKHLGQGFQERVGKWENIL